MAWHFPGETLGFSSRYGSIIWLASNEDDKSHAKYDVSREAVEETEAFQVQSEYSEFSTR